MGIIGQLGHTRNCSTHEGILRSSQGVHFGVKLSHYNRFDGFITIDSEVNTPFVEVQCLVKYLNFVLLSRCLCFVVKNTKAMV